MTLIKVRSTTQQITVDPATNAVAVVYAGPPGPAGPTGATGGSFSYVHVQVEESASWVINHNLGYHPNWNAEDTEGEDLWPAGKHHSINQLELQFNTPRAGTAHLT